MSMLVFTRKAYLASLLQDKMLFLTTSTCIYPNHIRTHTIDFNDLPQLLHREEFWYKSIGFIGLTI